MKIKALASWYGSNRMLAVEVGTALDGLEWVGVPFVGGCSELAHIRCRTGVANDLHRHIINLARVASDPLEGPLLRRHLRKLPFHPETLADAQTRCRTAEGNPNALSRIQWAADYFVCSWMGRNGSAGTKGEFNAGLSFRWEAGGGDSVVRFQSAVASLREWRDVLSRWTFDCRDAFEFLDKCQDKPGHGIYCDPPFPGPGNSYKHNCGKGGDEVVWHTRLAERLATFERARVVCRFYDVPLVRDLYPEDRWEWRLLEGRKATNDKAPEVLLINALQP